MSGLDPREAARRDVFPGGRLSDEAHRKLARLAEATNRSVATKNVEHGWCPCGEELDSECECGISRLSYVQGKAEPLKRSSLHPRLIATTGELKDGDDG